jgi:hypothetical protein
MEESKEEDPPTSPTQSLPPTQPTTPENRCEEAPLSPPLDLTKDDDYSHTHSTQDDNELSDQEHTPLPVPTLREYHIPHQYTNYTFCTVSSRTKQPGKVFLRYGSTSIVVNKPTLALQALERCQPVMINYAKLSTKFNSINPEHIYILPTEVFKLKNIEHVLSFTSLQETFRHDYFNPSLNPSFDPQNPNFLFGTVDYSTGKKEVLVWELSHPTPDKPRKWVTSFRLPFSSHWALKPFEQGATISFLPALEFARGSTLMVATDVSQGALLNEDMIEPHSSLRLPQLSQDLEDTFFSDTHLIQSQPLSLISRLTESEKQPSGLTLVITNNPTTKNTANTMHITHTDFLRHTLRQSPN